MLDVVASFYTERDTADGIATEKATCDAYAPLIASALVLKSSSLLFLIFTVRTLEQHRLAFTIKTGNADEFSLFFSDEKFLKLSTTDLLST